MTVNAEFSNQQQGCIDELRERMKGDMDMEMFEDTYVFWRFLKARDFNINNAEAMLRKHLEWRKAVNIENIANYKIHEVIEKYVANVVLGFDKEGCLIRYCPVGDIDLKGIAASMASKEVLRYIIFESTKETELLKSQSKKLGRNVDKCVYIYNLANLTFEQATDKKIIFTVIQILKVFQDNYPERLKAAFILNTSLYFTFMYSALKPFLAGTILNKVHVYSDDSYKEDILKLVDADVLPAFLGGTKTDPDGNPLCLTIINQRGPVPESYHIHQIKKSLCKAPGVKKVTLPRASFHELFLEVKEPGSYLEWEFQTKCRDIGFGLFHQQVSNGEENNIELIPIQRIDTNEYAEAGNFKCEEPGSYVLVFDNTYSWIRTKEIYYRIKVLTPKEYETQVVD